MTNLDEIHAALNNNEFFLEYLPIMALDSGRCAGAEALLRWQRPTGTAYPDDFVPLVEGTPLSGLMTYWVIERAATELGNWLREEDDVDLHVNVPPEILGRLEVVVEGVETARQLELLRDIGVRRAQGYYFSRPLRADAFLEFYRGSR